MRVSGCFARRGSSLAGQIARFLAVTLACTGPMAGHGAVQGFTPVADTSLMEVAPTNNNGAAPWILSGTTQNGPNVRGLLRFDLSALPTNTLIRSAQVTLTVTRQPSDGLENAPFGLHRMLKDWSEGAQFSSLTPGQGAPAQPGETTWNYRHYPTHAWAAPGGAVGVDYAGIQSSFQFIYGADVAYLFENTPEMVADVQGWVRRPDLNFGWMLKCADEGIIFTGRRFGSREDAVNAPGLEIDYLVQPVIEGIQRQGTNVQLWFTQWPGQAYELQAQSSTQTNWQPIASFPAGSTNVQQFFSEPATAPDRSYRLLAW
jgi:hypothetical protein